MKKVKNKKIIYLLVFISNVVFSQDSITQDSIKITNSKIGDFLSLSRCFDCEYLKVDSNEIMLLQGFDSTLLDKKMYKETTFHTMYVRDLEDTSPNHNGIDNVFGNKRDVEVSAGQSYIIHFKNSNTSIDFTNINVLGNYFNYNKKSRRTFKIYKTSLLLNSLSLLSAVGGCAILFKNNIYVDNRGLEKQVKKSNRNAWMIVGGSLLTAYITIPICRKSFKNLIKNYNSSF